MGAIDLRQLRYFVVLAEERHFSRAAEQLGISQPPLTRQIQELEQGLGARLFDRNKHSVELTPAGRVFLEETRKTLEQGTRSVQLAQRAAGGDPGRLNLGVAPLLETSVYHALELRIRRSFPHLEIKCHVLPRSAAHDDAGHNEFAKGKTVRMEEFCAQSRVVIRKKFNSGLYRYVNDICHRNCYHAARVVPVSTLPELLNAVLKREGVAVVPASLKGQVTSSLRYIRLQEKNADIHVGLVRPRDRGSPALRLARRIIQEMEWPSQL